jgi:hypothetical protein
METNCGIDFEIVYVEEEHCIELDVRAGNGRFAGASRFYEAPSELRRLARRLEGFPHSVGEDFRCELGSLDPEQANGGLRLLWRAPIPSGRVFVDVHIRSDTMGEGAEIAIADFVLTVEPAAIDRFARELASLPIEVGATARLAGAK